MRDFIETLPGAVSAQRTEAAMQQDGPKKFAMVRTNKIKDLASLGGRGRHNSRTAREGTEHATSPNPRYSGKVYPLSGKKDAVEAWHKKLSERGVDPKKLRKDSVKAIEMVLTASGDWFDNATPEERLEWVKRGRAFAEKKFGKENILSASLHDDETTPHIHVLAVPLVHKTRAKRGRARKGREGAVRSPQRPQWGLSAKDFIGGSKHQHSKLQTEWWEAVADLGLRRGIPKKITGARNMSPAQYRAQQERKLSEIEDKDAKSKNHLQAAAQERQKATSDRKKAEEQLTAANNAVEALSLGLDAIDVGELEHKPRTPETSEHLSRVPVRHPVLPEDQQGMKGWAQSVKPYMRALISYARKIARIKDREDQLERSAAVFSAVRREHKLPPIAAVEEIKTKSKRERDGFGR